MPKKRPPLWFEDTNPFEIKKPMMRFQMPMSLARTIPIKMAEVGDGLVLRAELPGFEKSDIKLRVAATSVSITATKKKQHVERTEKMFKHEAFSSSASRMITLPIEIKPDGVRAKFTNGILEITMPKKEAKRKLEGREIRPE